MEVNSQGSYSYKGKVSAYQHPKTHEEEQDMSHVPYVSAVGSLNH
jgi:hypothetical protein